jgi:cysteine protease ATG4
LTNDQKGLGLRVYVSGDSPDVYEDAFMETAISAGAFTPTLLLVGIRLGIDRVTPVYWEALKSTLHLRQSIGIAGGRPSSSHYFVGTQGQHFFYLDPHITRIGQPLRPSPMDYSEEEVDSFHTRRIRRLHIKEMDPSMLIAFLIRDEDDWKDWRTSVACVQGKPIIHVSDKEPKHLESGGSGRAGAVDEVESFDGLDDDEQEIVV